MPTPIARRTTVWSFAVVVIGSLLTSGCATLFLQEDGFSDRMHTHCQDHASCADLLQQALDRVRHCQHNTVGHVRCEDALADARWLAREVDYHEQQEQAAKEQARQADEQARRAVEREQLEEFRRQERAAAEEKIREEEEEALATIRKAEAQEREDWRRASVETCKRAASLDACTPLRRYLAQYEAAGSPHITEARAALATSAPALAALADEDRWSHLRLADCKHPRTALSCQRVLAYTQTFPTGKHADEARKLLANSERAIAQLAAAEERKLLLEQQQADQRSAALDRSMREAEAARKAALIRQMVADAAAFGQAYLGHSTPGYPGQAPTTDHVDPDDDDDPPDNSSSKRRSPDRKRSWFSRPSTPSRSWFGRSNSGSSRGSSSGSSDRGRGK